MQHLKCTQWIKEHENGTNCVTVNGTKEKKWELNEHIYKQSSNKMGINIVKLK